ncbi:response regulator transcription factor [Cohnella algarum]|uniref:response regulator transcription factor n=1 Tax=Cohnella algarum TaxID=2044859 RepID=UPI001967009C|nr:response regulator [Cohnella algarum]MBN2979928.1 response regulator [Cohnella algarum]
MRKVMVVDDEKWVRRGLVQSIPWDRLGLRLAGEAADGQDAFEMALELKPDLMFLDMRMPGLDGKQLLAMLGGAMPGLVTIVVSGYSDFEYTKQAIRHHAFDYLLKPVKKEELASVLEKALEELDRRDGERLAAEEGRRGDGWFRDLLLAREPEHPAFSPRVGRAEAEARSKEGGRPENAERSGGEGRPERTEPARRESTASDEEGEVPSSWAGKEAVVFAAQADRYPADGGGAAWLRALREKFGRERAFYFGGDWQLALSPAPDGRPEAVGAVAAGKLPAPELKRLLADIQAELKRQGGSGCSIGASEVGPAEASRLRRAYAQAQAALAGRQLGEREKILFAAAADPPGSSLQPYPQKREQAFLLALQLGNKEEAEREFDLLFASISGETATVDQLQRGAILLVHALERQLRAAETSLESVCGKHPLALAEALRLRVDPESVRAVFSGEIIPAVLKAAGRRGETQGEQIVREVLKLIETHYDQPLSLQHIAESRFVNPDYLSRLFKKTTGSTFVDYLADIRIRKSMELMKVPTYKNYEIAHKVGYEDYRYFSQIFKKKTGKTIGEFRSAAGCGKT